MNSEGWEESPVHAWFGLTYSSYLVLQRSVMEAMPMDWQRRMVALLEECYETVDADKIPGQFWVRARDGRQFVQDPYRDYRHPPDATPRHNHPVHARAPLVRK